MAERVRITDVAPRDGLQNEPGVIQAADKVRLVELLSATGVDEIEVSSFVSPKWVPQLADADEVFAALAERTSSTHSGGAAPVFSALVPNEKGMEAALEVNRRAGRALIRKINLFTAASETFNKRNTNATIDESFERFQLVVRSVAQHGLAVRVYVSCVIACPFEGDVPPTQAALVAGRARGLLDHSDLWRNHQQPGIAGGEVVLADTIGAGTPGKVALLLRKVDELAKPFILNSGGPYGLGLHLHDTFGRAADCVREALKFGVRSFDGSVAGLGGCPYASTPGQRAPGNISTELLVRTIHDAGYETGVDLDRVREAAAFAARIVGAARAGATP